MDERFGRSGEYFGAAFADDKHILDANSEVCGEVDARLDCNDHTGLEGSFYSGTDAGPFVDFKADAVAGGVGEGFRKAGGAKDGAGGLIYGTGGDPGANGGDAGLLGGEDCIISGELAGGELAKGDGAGHVRAVAVEDDAEVEGEEAVAGEFAIGGAAVGECGAGAGGDDGFKAHGFGTAAAGLVLELGGDGEFREAGLEEAEHVVEDGAAEGGGLAHEGDFVLVLDVAEGFEDRGCDGLEEGAAEGGGEGRAPEIEFSEGEVGGLVGDGAGGGLGGEPADGSEGGGTGDDFNAGGGGFVRSLVAVAGVCEEAHCFAGDEEGRGGAGEAGEVMNVGEVRDEEGRETGPGELPPQAGDAEGMVHPLRYITGRGGAGTQGARTGASMRP